MAKLVLSSEGGGGDFEFETAPEGVYTARCYRIIDLGTQPVTWEGDTKYKHQVTFGWELIGENDPRMKDGRPFSVHKTYTASLDERSTLYADLKMWRGKSLTEDEALGFDIFSMLGEYAQLQVLHKKSKDGSRTYVNVGALMPSTNHPEKVNEDMAFEIGEPDMAVFEKLGDKLKEKIQNAPEWKNAPKQQDTVVDVDADKEVTIEDLGGTEDDINPDDIPF